MPTFRSADDSPVVRFDPLLEISPFALFRRLRSGSAPRLVDIRPPAAESDRSAVTLRGAEHPESRDWSPAEDEDEEIVLFDDHGNEAAERARALQAAGFTRVRALFGGLDLYRFSLDPEIVGGETFLVDS